MTNFLADVTDTAEEEPKRHSKNRRVSVAGM